MRAELEQSLTEAVRTSHPEFETFAGVIVERIVPAKPRDTRTGLLGASNLAGRIATAAVQYYWTAFKEAQVEFEISH
jgi:hypothetical protein